MEDTGSFLTVFALLTVILTTILRAVVESVGRLLRAVACALKAVHRTDDHATEAPVAFEDWKLPRFPLIAKRVHLEPYWKHRLGERPVQQTVKALLGEDSEKIR